MKLTCSFCTGTSYKYPQRVFAKGILKEAIICSACLGEGIQECAARLQGNVAALLTRIASMQKDRTPALLGTSSQTSEDQHRSQ